MIIGKGKGYWADIPKDGPKAAKADIGYIGPCSVVHFGASGLKAFVKLPIDHFFYRDNEPARYVCISLEYLSEL